MRLNRELVSRLHASEMKDHRNAFQGYHFHSIDLSHYQANRLLQGCIQYLMLLKERANVIPSHWDHDL